MTCSNATQRLIDACKTGNIDTVKQSILDGADALAENNSVIQVAAANGHLAVVKWLVNDSGQAVDVTARDNYAVRSAAANGHLEVVKWLVNNSGQAVDVVAADNLAVRLAAVHGQLEVVKWLVNESGQAVDVTAADNYALRWAAEDGHLATVKWLVKESGQQVDVTADNNSALRLAVQNGHLDVVKWLVLESGQLFQMLQKSTDWLSMLQRDELRQVAIYGYGIEPTAYRTAELLDVLQKQTPLERSHVLDRLDALGIPRDDQAVYLVSPACRQILKTGLVTSTAQLEELLERTTTQHAILTVRL